MTTEDLERQNELAEQLLTTLQEIEQVSRRIHLVTEEQIERVGRLQSAFEEAAEASKSVQAVPLPALKRRAESRSNE